MALTNAQRIIKEHRENPVKFVYDRFKVDPDPWQRQALMAFASKDPAHMRISLQACAGPGKSAVLAWCGWNFLSCYGSPGEHPKAAAVSVTGENLKDNLWAEMAKWQERDEFLKTAFHWTAERISSRDHYKTWFMSARSYAKRANPDEVGRTLSGLHSKYVLYLIDESGDIPPQLVKSAEQGLSTGPVFGKIVQAGNPTSHEGMLYAAATTLKHLWHLIRITGDPNDVNRSTRIKLSWAKEQIDTYGRDNPWVMAYILGMFPPSSINTLMGPDEVMAAMQRHITKDKYEFSQKRLGVDVARFGDDRTVLFPRQGLAAFKPAEMRGARSNEIAARVMAAREKWHQELDFVDDTGGWGSGVVDSLIQAKMSPMAINFAGKAINPKFYNKRAEMWFLMADWMKRGSLPNIPQLSRELTAPTYTLKDGKFLLEEKAQIKERLGVSPDYADALALTFALPEMPAKTIVPGFSEQKIKTEYNPMEENLRNAMTGFAIGRCKTEYDPMAGS